MNVRKLSAEEVQEVMKKRRAEYASGKRCPACGFEKVEIRGRHPNEPRRKVCPQCLQEKMDTIKEVSEPSYGIPCREAK